MGIFLSKTWLGLSCLVFFILVLVLVLVLVLGAVGDWPLSLRAGPGSVSWALIALRAVTVVDIVFVVVVGGG